MQVISLCDQIFSSKKKLKLWLKPYEILATGPGCGIIEFLNDALSIDYIKRKLFEKNNLTDLVDFFSITFGKPQDKKYIRGIKNFADSLSAYSLIYYVL